MCKLRTNNILKMIIFNMKKRGNMLFLKNIKREAIRIKNNMNIIIHIKNDEIYIFYNILHLYIYIYTFMYGINY
jgi:hypothetical protein